MKNLIIFCFFLLCLGNVASLWAQKKLKKVNVGTTEELINALVSGNHILLTAPKYILTNLSPNLKNPNVQLIKTSEGVMIQVQNLQNVQISGNPKTLSKLLHNATDAYVLSFKNCENLVLEYLEAGHAPSQSQGRGGVLGFYHCKKIQVNHSILLGSSGEGITLESVSEAKFNNLTIRGCAYGIMTLTGVRDISFENSRFTDNRQFDMITVNDGEHIRFNQCQIDFNRTGRGEISDNYALINAVSDSYTGGSFIFLTNCKIEDNFCQYFCRSQNAVKLDNCQMDNNTFERGYNSNN
ncbi:MAG: hypothetical protein MUE85_24755 [Microscillaceae bacterium]|jgi:hypothetical protein|nr:hypothetical protein [Microscillaceae bacterium]